MCVEENPSGGIFRNSSIEVPDLLVRKRLQL